MKSTLRFLIAGIFLMMLFFTTQVAMASCGGGSVNPNDKHKGEGGRYCGTVTYNGYTLDIGGSADGAWIAKNLKNAINNGGYYACGNGSSSIRIVNGSTPAPSPCTSSNLCSGDNIVEQCSGSTTPCPYGCTNGTCNTCPDGICPSCGTISNQVVDSAPSSNLCTQGTPSSVSVQLGSRAWQWDCSRLHSGNAKSIACSDSCGVGKWICDGKCISTDSPCSQPGSLSCVGSRQLIGNVCAGSDNVSTNGGVGTGFGLASTSSAPVITLAARVAPDTMWHQANASFIIASGKIAELAWAVVGASDCAGSSPFFSSQAFSTSTKTSILTESQTFTLTCKNTIGSLTKTIKIAIPSVSEF